MQNSFFMEHISVQRQRVGMCQFIRLGGSDLSFWMRNPLEGFNGHVTGEPVQWLQSPCKLIPEP